MKILVLGCNGIADYIVSKLVDIKDVTEICIAAREKSDCDVLRNKYSGRNARIMTARVDLANEAGTKMMLSITQPDLIVSVAPAEYSVTIMKLALGIGADYIDTALYEWEDETLLSSQFGLFSDFKSIEKTAVVGCGLNPGLIASLIRYSLIDSFLKIDSADLLQIHLTNDDPGEGQISFVEDGARKKADALSVCMETDYEAFGKKTLYMTNSPITEIFLKESTDVPNVRSFIAYELEQTPDYSKELELLGMLSDEPLEVAPGVSVSPKQFWNLLQDSKKVVNDELPGPCGVGIVIKGEKSGASKRELISITGDNNKCIEEFGMPCRMLFTAYTLLAGIKLMISGKWSRFGVYSPSAFNAEHLINEVKALGLEINRKELPAEG